jgi:carbonic anhydrase
MSIIDRALEANRKYAKGYDPALGKRPAPKLAVVTCMDPRLSDLPPSWVYRTQTLTLSVRADPR